VLLFVTGCGPSTAATTTPDPATLLPADNGKPTQMSTPTSPIPVDPNLQDLIQKAKEDLAKRLSLSSSQINLLDAQAVVWPDSSLGCPEEGMAYAQVLTPGYLIRLEVNNQELEYHASRKTIIYCENPSPPVPGAPTDN